MTDKPTTPDGVKFDGTAEDVEGHKYGKPGGIQPEVKAHEPEPDGVKFDDTEQDVEGHKK